MYLNEGNIEPHQEHGEILYLFQRSWLSWAARGPLVLLLPSFLCFAFCSKYALARLDWTSGDIGLSCVQLAVGISNDFQGHVAPGQDLAVLALPCPTDGLNPSGLLEQGQEDTAPSKSWPKFLMMLPFILHCVYSWLTPCGIYYIDLFSWLLWPYSDLSSLAFLTTCRACHY